MNGLNEIKNINLQRVIDKATELKHKAHTARKQNHPKADSTQSEYDTFKAVNGPTLEAAGFKESE